jgi:Ca2+-binding EF-hand superfamily protein
LSPLSLLESVVKKAVIVALVGALAAWTVAVSEEQESHHGRSFERWDANSDGVVTRDEVEREAAERAARMFDSLDADRNGTLTKDELQQAHEKKRSAMRERGEERFKAADKNGDGNLSKEEAGEAMPHLAKNFERLDANKDGLLSSEELRSVHKGRHGRHSQ